MLIAAGSSAFLSNTNSTAVLMPATIDAGKKAAVAPSRLLLPLAFASMLEGTCTLIGTSTNMAASGLFVGLGLEPLGLDFDHDRDQNLGLFPVQLQPNVDHFAEVNAPKYHR